MKVKGIMLMGNMEERISKLPATPECLRDGCTKRAQPLVGYCSNECAFQDVHRCSACNREIPVDQYFCSQECYFEVVDVTP
jgi:hypothetical protein